MSAHLVALGFKGTEFDSPRHAALIEGLSALFAREELSAFEKLVDPQNHLGPPGSEWAFLCRRFRYGEFALAKKATLELEMRYGILGTRERAAAEIKRSLPPASENPHSNWPIDARFRAMFLDQTAEIDALGKRAEYPEMYYDASTFQRITQLLMAAHAKTYPDDEREARTRILRHVAWWVAHDSDEPPGSKAAT